MWAQLPQKALHTGSNIYNVWWVNYFWFRLSDFITEYLADISSYVVTASIPVSCSHLLEVHVEGSQLQQAVDIQEVYISG